MDLDLLHLRRGGEPIDLVGWIQQDLKTAWLWTMKHRTGQVWLGSA